MRGDCGPGVGQRIATCRRGPRPTTAAYDPVTCQVRLVGGKVEVEAMLDLLTDEGVITVKTARKAST